MTLDDFKRAFEKKCLSIDILYVQAHDFINMRKDNMKIKEFSTRLNTKTKYVLGVASIDKDKMEIFINRLKLNIGKNVMM